MQKAKELIGGELKLTVIAEQVGYAKRATKMSSTPPQLSRWLVLCRFDPIMTFSPRGRNFIMKK
jgi:hypothetical protein